jgi:hypothetical protein
MNLNSFKFQKSKNKVFGPVKILKTTIFEFFSSISWGVPD